MELYYALGFLVLVFTLIFDYKLLRVDVTFLLRSTLLITLVVSVSTFLNLLLGRSLPLPPVDPQQLLLVGWEDLVFSLLLIHFPVKYLHPKAARLSIICSCIIFGCGHLYQGYFTAFLISFAPFFISYRIGKDKGWGTAIAIHTIYDLLILAQAVTLIKLR